MASKFAYGGLKEWVFAIAAIIYVGGMFLLFYVYATRPGAAYTLVPNLTYLSIFGCFLLFGLFFVGVWKTPKEPQGS